MKHVFTTREKVLLVILAVLLIAVGYWKLILTPINDSIAQLQSQTSSEQDAMLQSTAQLARLQQMKRELETLLADPDAKPLPAYDNAEQLLVELKLAPHLVAARVLRVGKAHGTVHALADVEMSL